MQCSSSFWYTHKKNIQNKLHSVHGTYKLMLLHGLADVYVYGSLHGATRAGALG